MVVVRLENIVLPGIVTLGSGAQLVYFAQKVFNARERLGIQYPAITGNEEFERIFRAQQNTLEWYPIYMSALWTGSLFFHQVPAAICGVIYMVGRHKYFHGYSRSVEGRLPGFFLAGKALMGMLLMAAVGLLGTLLKMHHCHRLGPCFRPSLNHLHIPNIHFRFRS